MARRRLEPDGRRDAQGRARQGVRLHRRRQRRMRLAPTCVHKMVELGLRPLAVHFDNTWNSPIATANIYTVLDELDVDLETYVVDNKEYDDIYRSFMLAGVKDVEAPTDIGFMGALYRAAEKHGIKYIVEGHSFRTEGVSPLGWLYMDGGYIKAVHEQFGTRADEDLPEHGLPAVRPVGGLQRDPAASGRCTTSTTTRRRPSSSSPTTYGWQWYGGHHLENRFTAFYHSYFLPAAVRHRLPACSGYSGARPVGPDDPRGGAAELMAEPPSCDPEIVGAREEAARASTTTSSSAVMTVPAAHLPGLPDLQAHVRAPAAVLLGAVQARSGAEELLREVLHSVRPVSAATKPARIALVGNTVNCLLPVALALRDAGFDADLFVDDHAPSTSRPESVDPTLANVAWVRRGPWFPSASVLAPWWAPIVRELRGYDLLLVSGPGPVYAQWARRPYLWWASGHDLTAAPFPWAFRHLYRTWPRRLAAFPLALWQRRGARPVVEIWVQPFTPFRDAVQAPAPQHATGLEHVHAARRGDRPERTDAPQRGARAGRHGRANATGPPGDLPSEPAPHSGHRGGAAGRPVEGQRSSVRGSGRARSAGSRRHPAGAARRCGQPRTSTSPAA